jgi:hypothetical protein
MISQGQHARNYKEISFNAVVPGKEGLVKTTFGTGWGPCGRWVKSLEVSISLAAVEIRQESYARETWEADPGASVPMVNGATREIKHFVYKLEDIAGRITAIEA